MRSSEALNTSGLVGCMPVVRGKKGGGSDGGELRGRAGYMSVFLRGYDGRRPSEIKAGTDDSLLHVQS